MLAVQQLGQREVVARLGAGTGAHGDAEAGPARVGADDGDEEGVLAPGLVAHVRVGPVPQHPVVDGDGVQVAGADAEDGVRRVAEAARCPPRRRWRTPSGVRLPDHMSSRDGNSTDFQLIASAAYPNSASSSRRRSR